MGESRKRYYEYVMNNEHYDLSQVIIDKIVMERGQEIVLNQAFGELWNPFWKEFYK